MAVGYPDEVWDALKQEYENGPKISWAKLCEVVGEFLGCDLPSPSIVRRRAIAEKWKRKAIKVVKKSARGVNQEIKKNKQNLTQNDDQQGAEKKEKTVEKNDQKSTSNIAKFDVKNEGDNGQKRISAHQLTSAKVIKINRDRLYKLGMLAGDTIESVIHIRDEVLELDETKYSPEEIEQKKELIDYKMRLIAQVVGLNLNQSITLSNIGRMDAIYWGLEQDELKDQEELLAKRTAVVNASQEKLEQAKRAMSEAKRKAFLEQIEFQQRAMEFEKNGE